MTKKNKFSYLYRAITQDTATVEKLKWLYFTLLWLRFSGTVSTYKAFSSVIHQAELEALLILKSFSQGVSQAVRGKYALPALLKLAEYALEKKTKQTKNDY